MRVFSLTPIKDVGEAAVRDGYSAPFVVGPDGRVLLLHTTGRDHLAVIFNWAEAIRGLEQGGAR